MASGRRHYAVGYQGITLPQLLDSLADACVTLVVDTRENPASRRPEFRSGPLADALMARSIQYVSLPQLGAPKALREAVGHWPTFAAGYRRRLKTQQLAIEQLKAMARGKRVCLLCFEDDPDTCHRSLLVKELERQLPAATFVELRPGRVDEADDREGIGMRLHRA